MINYSQKITLIGKDSKGKLRLVIAAYGWDDGQHGFVIHRTTGTYKGKLTSQPELLITKGKVKRTVTEQALLEFNSIIKKYKDKGYKELEKPLDEYSEEELNEIIGDDATNQSGVLKPMLAKQSDKVTNIKIFDKLWFASRKIDGTRCLMYYTPEDDTVHTVSRGGTTYDYSTNHIRKHSKLVEFMRSHPNFILDGELYKHGVQLSKISGAVRLEKNAYDCDWLEFYIYDVVRTDLTFSERLEELGYIKEYLNLSFDPNRDWEEGELQVQIVPHVPIKGWDNMMELHNTYVSEGFEGLVIRDPSKPYKPNGRTNDMLKIKKYQDSEFEIIGISEGLREEDMCFTLITEEGKEFKAKPMGSRELKQQYRTDLDSLIGKQATVKFFYYSDDNIPLQPVLKAIRDYE